MNDGVTVREFARQIGKSHVWVMKLIKEEVLPRYTDGTIPLEQGLKAYEDYSAQPKNKRGRPANGTKKEKAPPTPPPERIKKQQPEIPLSQDVEQAPDLSTMDKANRTKEAVNINAAFNKAKLAEKTYQARLRELEYKMKSGELLEKTAVAAEAQWLAEQVKAKLMSIPPRVSSMCEGRIARDIEEILTDSINSALKELQKCKYTGEQK